MVEKSTAVVAVAALIICIRTNRNAIYDSSENFKKSFHPEGERPTNASIQPLPGSFDGPTSVRLHKMQQSQQWKSKIKSAGSGFSDLTFNAGQMALPINNNQMTSPINKNSCQEATEVNVFIALVTEPEILNITQFLHHAHPLTSQ